MSRIPGLLGILGGIFGIIAALFAMFFGGIVGMSISEEGALLVGLGIGALISSIIGIIGGAISFKSTKWAGILMLIGGVAGIISISFFYVLPGILLIIGGIFSFLIKKTP